MDDILFFFNAPLNMINDMYFVDRMTLREWDRLLAEGWRHNGMMVFRTSHDLDDVGRTCYILPLRYRLQNFQFSKSQRKIFRKNADLTHVIRPMEIDDEKHDLFFRHIEKFTFRKPSSIWDFVSPEPNKPFKNWELSVYDKDRLIACSFIDVTTQSISSTYAMYDLEEGKRSLGIYTMILEIMYGIEKKKKFYYPGYVYDTPSFYDYKKKFANTEFYDWWSQRWLPYDMVEPEQ